MNIRRDVLEASILAGLRTHLMEPELFKAFFDEFIREVNRLRMERDATASGWRTKIDQAIQVILDSVPGYVLKEKLDNLEAGKAELLELVERNAEPTPLLHPNMAGIYRRRTSELPSGFMMRGKPKASRCSARLSMR